MHIINNKKKSWSELTVIPMDVEGYPDEDEGVSGEGEHERHPLPGVADGEQLLHEVVPERVHHQLRGVARHAGEDVVDLALAVVEPLLQQPAPVLVARDVGHDPAQAGQALAVRLVGRRRRGSALLGARRRHRAAAAVLPPHVLAPGPRRGGRWRHRNRRRRGAPDVPAVGGSEGDGIKQRRHVRAVAGHGERVQGYQILAAFLGVNHHAGEAEAVGSARRRWLVVAVHDAHRGEFVDEEREVGVVVRTSLAAAAEEATVVEEGDLVEQNLHFPVDLHLQSRR